MEFFIGYLMGGVMWYLIGTYVINNITKDKNGKKYNSYRRFV